MRAPGAMRHREGTVRRSWAVVIVSALLVIGCGESSTSPSSSAGSSQAAEAPPSLSPTPEPTPEPAPTPEPSPTPVPEYQAPEDLAVGDCYDPIEDTDTEVLLAALLRPCDVPHAFEAFGVEQLPDPAAAPYPSDRDIEDASVELCDAAFEAYVGTSIDDSRYGYHYFTPTESSWADGDREVLCVIDDGTALITGSVQGTGQ